MLIIYYSQSGNTQKIAKRIARAGTEVDVVKLRYAANEMMDRSA